MNNYNNTKVFFCHADGDHELASMLAEVSRRAGIHTWLFREEAEFGRGHFQKISKAIGECTDFIVLCTPGSLDRPWVKAELEAGFERYVVDGISLIPVRFNFELEELPALLRGIQSPELQRDSMLGCAELIGKIFGRPLTLGVSRRMRQSTRERAYRMSV